MDFDRNKWTLGPHTETGPTPIHCAVCAKEGSCRGKSVLNKGRLWCCWECRDVVVAHKMLNGARIQATTYGPEFSDGTVYWGFFAD